MTQKVEDYEVIKLIGKGTFGTCYKVKRKCNSQIFVWKAIPYGAMPENKKKVLVSEVNLLSELRHPNIVRYYDRIIDKKTTTLYIIMECCMGGDLQTLIEECKSKKYILSEDFVWRVLYQLSCALQVCHGHFSKITILHRDIKPANVFLDSRANVKLGDFGLASIIHEEDSCIQQMLVGTPYYLSPEVIKGGKYNKKSDVWALGCLLYELCEFGPPFNGVDFKELARNIVKGRFHRISQHYSHELQKMIGSLLNTDPTYRPSVDSILENKTVDQVAHKITLAELSKVEDNIKKYTLAIQTAKAEAAKATYSTCPSDKNVNFTSENAAVTKESDVFGDISNQNFCDIWLRKLEGLRQRESVLRTKELEIEERERAIEKREKKVALFDKMVKEKLTRADVYLQQCRDSRSTRNGSRESYSQRFNAAGVDLDSSFSADPGDTSILPTTAKLDPKGVARPALFMRSASERHVHFNPQRPNIKKHAPANHGALTRRPNSLVYEQNLQEECCTRNVLGDIPENASQSLKNIEMDNLRNGVLAAFHSMSKLGYIKSESETKSTWKAEQSKWLVNKRLNYAYSLESGTFVNKENEPSISSSNQRLAMDKNSCGSTKSTKKSTVSVYATFPKANDKKKDDPLLHNKKEQLKPVHFR